MNRKLVVRVAFIMVLMGLVGGVQGADALGIFESHQDIGTVLHAGAAEFDQGKKAYTVTGSGANLWNLSDGFHFLWKKVSGDVSIAADISVLALGTEPHRKGCLMIRQTLDADSPYVDVAVHADGLTSLQFRDTKGEATHEVQANVTAANPTRRVRIEKRGKYTTFFIASGSEELHFSGAATRITFEEPFYVGLAVTAHNADQIAKAVFTDVELVSPLPPPTRPPVLYSTLETQVVASTDRRVTYVTNSRIEAPNWLRDGQTLIYNSNGLMYRIPMTGGTPEKIDTGFATRCNNDHAVSFDGTMLAISDQSQGQRRSLIYTLPITGGTPKLITPIGPSYFHGWSPDGKTLAFCGQRDGEFDIYTVPAEGGPETRLTTAMGLDDGPEYSADGNFIYFNSARTGSMQAFRMKPDGSAQEQLTDDEFNNWFPHVSPNGRTIVFVSFDKDVPAGDHPPNKDVSLRMMNLANKRITVMAKLFGGQGTANTPNWSPNGQRIAFVTYQLVP